MVSARSRGYFFSWLKASPQSSKRTFLWALRTWFTRVARRANPPFFSPQPQGLTYPLVLAVKRMTSSSAEAIPGPNNNTMASINMFFGFNMLIRSFILKSLSPRPYIFYNPLSSKRHSRHHTIVHIAIGIQSHQESTRGTINFKEADIACHLSPQT